MTTPIQAERIADAVHSVVVEAAKGVAGPPDEPDGPEPEEPWGPENVVNVGWLRDDRAAFVDSSPPNDGHAWYAVVLREDFNRLRTLYATTEDGSP